MNDERPQYRPGLDEFLAYVSRRAGEVVAGRCDTTTFIRTLAEDCANLRLRTLKARPLTFLRQLTEKPPQAFGPTGFKPETVDDRLPARHYTALLFVGFWLPTPVALLVLYLWEMAGFVRYGGVWSRRDVVSGRIGIHHGRLVRRYGPPILPGLIAGQLAGRPDPHDR